jgi:hypothetical protein
MLRPSYGGKMRDTTIDARIVPYFYQYIRNPGVCAHTTEPIWDYQSNVVRKWISICMDEIWKPTNRLRAICLHPLRLNNHVCMFSKTYRRMWKGYENRFKQRLKKATPGT